MSDKRDAAKEAADALIEECVSDPDIWLTHGLPGEEKLRLVSEKIASILRTWER